MTTETIETELEDSNDGIRDGGQGKGLVTWQLFGPDGELKGSGQQEENICTQKGQQMYIDRGAGVGSPPNAPTGMKLGSGTTAAALTGAGSALVTYIANSHQAFDATFPSSAVNGAAWRVTYKCTFAAGKGTGNIQELVIVIDTLADATSTTANTAHRIVSAVGTKAAGDSLVVTWTYDLS